MPLTSAQRPKFFKLARAAYDRESPRMPFDDWRKHQMVVAGYPASTSLVDKVWGYEALMLHFATLAFDVAAVEYFTSCSERRLRWVLAGLATDLQFIQKTGVGEDYIAGIYLQAGLLPTEFADAPAQRLWCCLQILDTRIRRLCERDGIALRLLPTAGAPWCFRGVHASRYAAFVSLSMVKARVDAGLPTDATSSPSDAPVRKLSASA
jgi:hypothetical protein